MVRRRRPELELAVNRMNECADEMWKKSGYYPRQAVIARKELLSSDDPVKRFLGSQIELYSGLNPGAEPISHAIMRGSHLVRSILHKTGLYLPVSSPVSMEQAEFVKSCVDAKLDPPGERVINDVRKLVRFLSNTILQQFVWWGASYGTGSS